MYGPRVSSSLKHSVGTAKEQISKDASNIVTFIKNGTELNVGKIPSRDALEWL